MGHQLGSLSAGCAGGVNLDVPGGMPAGAILVPSGQAAILSFTMAVWVTFFFMVFPWREALKALAGRAGADLLRCRASDLWRTSGAARGA